MKAFLISALVAVSAASYSYSVGVWSTGEFSPNSVTDFLSASGQFSSVTQINTNDASAVNLSGFDSVLYYSNGSQDQDPTAIGNKLADYADTGHRLVIATFAFANQGNNTLAGRIMTAGYSPYSVAGSSLYTTSTLGATDGSAFWNGVNSISNHFRDNVSVVAGATNLGSYADGVSLLAKQGNVVGLNLFPNGSYLGVSGDYQQLTINALTVNAAAVPEPTTMVALGLGVLALKRKKSSK